MNPSRASRARKACLFIPLGLVAFCMLAAAASALSNRSLPQRSTVTDRLSALDKARLSEAGHLRRTLGEAAWPGWSQADIPIIVYNEQYVFLVGYADPPAGWLKVPSLEPRGGPWEAVPGNLFEGSPYYRTPLTDPLKTPQGFTVRVGDRWAATFQTREYTQIAFARDFRRQLPPLLADLVPVRLAWGLLMGKTEAYIAALEHEAFHAYQGLLAPDQLAAAERSTAFEGDYPFDAMEAPWKQEMELLLRAAQAQGDLEAREQARQFLQQRAARRAALNEDQAAYERLREWEEGLAKYAELEITRQASLDDGYTPVDGMRQDTDFKAYEDQARFWSVQLNEAKQTQGRSGDTRFTYSGNALAVVLDRLLPDWKRRALPGGEYLEDLLQEAVE